MLNKEQNDISCGWKLNRVQEDLVPVDKVKYWDYSQSTVRTIKKVLIISFGLVCFPIQDLILFVHNERTRGFF